MGLLGGFTGVVLFFGDVRSITGAAGGLNTGFICDGDGLVLLQHGLSAK